MRIAVVHPKVDRSGGAEHYAWVLVRELSARGHEVHVFARRAGGLPEDVRFHRVPAVPVGRALKTYSFWRLTSRKVPVHRFDVVQGFGKTTCQTVHRAGGGVHRAYMERQGGAAPSSYDRIVLKIEDRLFRSSQLRAIICPSRWVAREVERFYPGTAGRIHVVPNGVDTRVFRPEGRERDRTRLASERGIPPGRPWILFVGSNFRLKGLDRAVEALAHLDSAHLVVVGGGDPGPFARLATSRGCGERIHFVGRQADPAPWYRAADVLLHPTRYDPFANVCLEALACGTPVVSTPENGAADVLEEHPLAGRVCGPEARALAAGIVELLSAGAKARAAARSVAEQMDVSSHVDTVERLYEETVGGR